MPDTPQTMSIPMAIVIAGALIAGAVYFSKVGPSTLPVASQAPEQAQPTPSLDIRPVSADDHIRGAKNAKITILEYSDLECPYCKVFHESMVEVMKNYPDTVRWVYRHAPIESNHKNAFAGANAVECAALQGGFWELTDIIFANLSRTGLDLAKLPQYAKEAGVKDIPAFQKCVEEDTYRAKVEADLADGVKAGLRGTPFNMIILEDGQKVQLGGGEPYEQLKKKIDSLL